LASCPSDGTVYRVTGGYKRKLPSEASSRETALAGQSRTIASRTCLITPSRRANRRRKGAPGPSGIEPKDRTDPVLPTLQRRAIERMRRILDQGGARVLSIPRPDVAETVEDLESVVVRIDAEERAREVRAAVSRHAVQPPVAREHEF